jgi:L-threonylcarbamoyladenylate synthase
MTRIVTSLDEAVAVLDAPAVVAIPTDTVYGLAARIDWSGAAESLSSAKGRPADMPLQVLVSGFGQASSLGVFSENAARIASALWPGGVTLVVPAIDPDLAGRPTIGLRWPAHEITEAICERCGPLLATSANLHGGPPAETARAVAHIFGDSLAVVLDGGTCAGEASTVIDLTSVAPRVLRAGAVSREALEGVL